MGSTSLEHDGTDNSSLIDRTGRALVPTTPRDRDAEQVTTAGRIKTESSAATVIADPDSLDHVGATISNLGAVEPAPPLDPALLTDDVIGHAGLAQALRDFAGLWQQRLREVAERTTSIGTDLCQTARLYRDTDASAAQDFADLDPDRRPGARG
jgi:hypothetical protein